MVILLNNKKDIYTFSTEEGASVSEDENFNFVENFRSENANVGDKTFSFGLTYYLNESQTSFSSRFSYKSIYLVSDMEQKIILVMH